VSPQQHVCIALVDGQQTFFKIVPTSGDSNLIGFFFKNMYCLGLLDKKTGFMEGVNVCLNKESDR